MSITVVVAELWGGGLWDGPVVVQTVDPANQPTEVELAAIAVALTADNDGVRPIVRTVEQVGVPSRRVT